MLYTYSARAISAWSQTRSLTRFAHTLAHLSTDHEIMSASIGITDGQETLTYPTPSDYSDLTRGPEPGKAAFAQANVEQLPIRALFGGSRGRPTPTVHMNNIDDLTRLLYQYGRGADRAESGRLVSYLLKMAGKEMCADFLRKGKLEAAVQKKKISKSEAAFVRGMIQQYISLVPTVESIVDSTLPQVDGGKGL